MKTLRLLPALAGAVLLSGCYVNLTTPTPAVTVKLDAESANKKVGAATCTGLLWAFAFGDCSVDTAMRNGGVSRVHHVDARTKLVLYGVYGETTVQVYGE